MRALVWLLAGMMVGACSGTGGKDTPGTGTGNNDVVGDDDDDATTDLTGTDGTGGGGDGYMEPVAVGFELFATLEEDGTLTSFNYGDGVDYVPFVLITFADAEFFSATSEEAQAGHFCTAYGFMGIEPGPTPGYYYGASVVQPLTKPDQIPTRSQANAQGYGTGVDNAVAYWSYDVALAVNVDDHDCGGLVDPATWGPDAENLVDPFDGAHFGWAFGEFTTYLEQQWSEDTLTDIGSSMVASYVAINDASGAWYAYDWTTTILFQNDPDTNTTVADADGYLVGLPDVDLVVAGGALPEAYIQSYAFWYQDFPLLDLGNLRDGAPPAY